VQDSTGWSVDTLPYTFDVTLNKTPAKNAQVKIHMPKFSWQTVKGASRYHLQVFDDPSDCLAPSPTAVFETDTFTSSYVMKAPTSPLDFGTYYWRVRASEGTVTTAYGPCWRFDLSSLTAPKNGSVVANFLPKFAWSANSAAIGGYELTVTKINPDSTTTPVLTDFSVQAAKYTAVTDDGFGYGRFDWHVAEVGSLFGADTPDFTFYITAMSKPANRTVTTDTTPSFSWKKVTGASAYTVEVTTTDDPTFAAPVRTFPAGTALKYTILLADALPQGVYLWRVHVTGAPDIDMPAWTITIGP